MTIQRHRLPLFGLLLLTPLAASAKNSGLEHVFDADHIISYLMGILLMGFFILVFYNFVYRFREHDSKLKNKQQNVQLSLVLRTGNLRLWVYDLHTRHYILLSEEGDHTEEYNPIDFSSFFRRSDFEQLRTLIFDISEGRNTSGKVYLRSNSTNGDNVKHYEITVTPGHRNRKNELESLLCIQHDVTDDRKREESVRQTLMRYHTVFNSSLIDMIYYDQNGVLRDINEKACQTFNIPTREMVIKGNFLLQDNPMYAGIDFDVLENTHTSSIVDFANFQEEKYKAKEFGLKHVMYYESTINPIRNEKGELEGLYMAGRNVTEWVESFHRQKESQKLLRDATKSIREYIYNINYALRISDVRLANYNPTTFTLELSDNISETQMRLSQLRCIRLGSPRFRRAISSALNRMDHRTEQPIDLTFEIDLHDKQRRPIWVQFNMVPMKNNEGKVERYFGLCRNMTEMVETERRLAEESKKAHETDLLKQSFLTNMSYEIRTPLNTVVGFAELFETEHDEADEPLFVDEIKRNSNSLLKLVNDILFLSRIDANMIEYNKVETNFALLFDSYCQMGLSNVNPNVKTSLENPYEQLIADVDMEHIGMIIQRLCTNAAQYTNHGTIRAKYEYRHGEITITVEDTGRGFDENTLPHVFDRFTRNESDETCSTGLDLPIVKALTEQMGGTAEVQSGWGKGTTVWVTLPCTATSLVKRSDINVPSNSLFL